MNIAQTQSFQKRLTPGLYKLTVDGDARDFDWESLFVNLSQFGNVNQRTGPWDFMLDGTARPLVPAYWVWLNGRKIGLWYFNRPSVQQLTTKRMKGEAQFWIEREGDYEIRFEPYRQFELEWAEVRFEVSPDDTLLDEVTANPSPYPLPQGERKCGRPFPTGDDAVSSPLGGEDKGEGCRSLGLRTEAHRGLQRLFDAACWDKLRRNLDDPALPYGVLMREIFDWALKQETSIALPILAASYRVRPDPATLERARHIITKVLALPAWGNQPEDSYSHNGDMGCAQIIFDLSFTVNFLGDELGEPLVKELLARLDKQCEIFIELALLMHGYWGGSILQGHGFISFQLFTTAAYGLMGWLPRAEHWLRFCLPRMERSWCALPTDGVIPSTSYHRLDLHVGRLALLRELHRQATGQDIYDRPAFRNIVEFLVESYMDETGQFLHAAPRGDLTHHLAGHAFLDQMARTFRDADAAWLAQECRRCALNTPGDKGGKFNVDTLWASLLYEPRSPRREEGAATSNTPVGHLLTSVATRPSRRLRWFEDSGAIVYRDDAHGILFSSRLGNSNSRTSWRYAPGPCDRISFAPIAGNFAIARHGKPLIQTAEGGYSMRSEIANVLLVDGKGQRGDLGFAMGYPDAPCGDERIEDARLDAPDGTGYLRMQLAPAYDHLQSYTREWFFEPVGCMRLVDTIKCRDPHQFAWLFHTHRKHPITMKGGGVFTIQNRTETLELRLARSTSALADSIADTLTVWSYSNQQGNNACHHLAFETREAVSNVAVEFVLK